MRSSGDVSLLLAVILAGAPARAVTFAEALAAAARLADVSAPDDALAQRATLDRDTPGRVGNPELQVGLGPGSTEPGFRGVGTEFQATLLVPVALDDLGGARRRSVSAEREALVAEGHRRSLEQRRHVARAWLALWTAQRTLAVIDDESRAAASLAEERQRAVSLGAAVTADAQEAALVAAEARGRTLDAEGEVSEAALTLAAHAGLPVAPPPRADGDAPAPALPEASSWPQWIARAERLPEARAAAWLARASELLAEESSANASSWASVGAQAVRNSADQWQLYAMVGLRPSVSDRNQRARAQALTQAALARGEFASARRRAAAALALALHEVEHSREVSSLLRERTTPLAEQLVAGREGALQRGAGTTVDVLRARGERLRVRTSAARAEGRRVSAELDAWLLLGALANTPEAR
jgi:cobalt-zinc-cadmium efflux system outer membrane protein